MKRQILNGFSRGFEKYREGDKLETKEFFSNYVIKNTSYSLNDSDFIIGSAEEKLYNVLVYS